MNPKMWYVCLLDFSFAGDMQLFASFPAEEDALHSACSAARDNPKHTVHVLVGTHSARAKAPEVVLTAVGARS